MRKLLVVPNEILRQSCEPINRIDGEIKELAKEMVEFMETARPDKPVLVGLAASQLGVPIRMFTYTLNPYGEDRQIQVVINPELVRQKDLHSVNETCLSLPGRTFTLQRFKLVKVRGITLDEAQRSFKGRDLVAQIFQHELDHLEGILLDERTKQRWDK